MENVGYFFSVATACPTQLSVVDKLQCICDPDKSFGTEIVWVGLNWDCNRDCSFYYLVNHEASCTKHMLSWL